MSSAWGKSWGMSWGNSWGSLDNAEIVYVANTLRITKTCTPSRILSIPFEDTETKVKRECRFVDVLQEITIADVCAVNRFQNISFEIRFVDTPRQVRIAISGDISSQNKEGI